MLWIRHLFRLDAPSYRSTAPGSRINAPGYRIQRPGERGAQGSWLYRLAWHRGTGDIDWPFNPGRCIASRWSLEHVSWSLDPIDSWRTGTLILEN